MFSGYRGAKIRDFCNFSLYQTVYFPQPALTFLRCFFCIFRLCNVGFAKVPLWLKVVICGFEEQKCRNFFEKLLAKGNIARSLAKLFLQLVMCFLCS